jgi:hypothetical protein
MASETVVGLNIKVTIKGTVISADGISQVVDINKEYNFSDGTGNNQCQAWFYDASRSVAQAGEDVDLNGSASYTDFKGAALDMVQMSVFFLENLDTDTGDSVTITRPGAAGVTGMQAASDVTTVQPGGMYLWIAPGPDKATTTATTADLINLAAADASGSSVKLFIAGDNT